MPDPGTALAVFPSLNQVALVKRALHREGVYVEMLRTPKCLSSTGCSFALRCTLNELDAVRDACTRAGMAWGGAFEERKTESGIEYRPRAVQD